MQERSHKAMVALRELTDESEGDLSISKPRNKLQREKQSRGGGVRAKVKHRQLDISDTCFLFVHLYLDVLNQLLQEDEQVLAAHRKVC